jgi:nucleotide-binding universal stress UspA family protein
MYKTILVPLDGSKRAEAILAHVRSLAERYGSKIVLLHIQEPGLFLGRDEVVDFTMQHTEFEQRKREGEKYLEEKMQDFMKRGFETEAHLLFGPIVKTIIDVAETSKADLIAMCSHGLGGISRMFYGSVAAGVLQRIDRPLLMIRSRNAD